MKKITCFGAVAAWIVFLIGLAMAGVGVEWARSHAWGVMLFQVRSEPSMITDETMHQTWDDAQQAVETWTPTERYMAAGAVVVIALVLAIGILFGKTRVRPLDFIHNPLAHWH